MAINDKNIANADFWSNLAAENIYNTPDKRASSVKSLQTLIAWAFGLFATTGFVITLFGQLKDFNQYALYSFGLAFFLLTIAYGLANKAQYPVPESYNPSAPTEVASAFTAVVKKQSAYFNSAAALTSIGFFFLALGILILFANAKASTEGKTKSAGTLVLNASAQQVGNSLYVPVSIQAGKNDSVRVQIFNASPKVPDTSKLLFAYYTQADTNGLLFHSYSKVGIDSVTALRVTASIRKTNFNTTTEYVKTVNLTVK